MATGIRIEGRIARLEARSAARTAAARILALDLRNVPDDELQAMWVRSVGDRVSCLRAGDLTETPDDDPAGLHDLVGQYMAALNRMETRPWQA